MIILWQEWQSRILHLIYFSTHLFKNITHAGSFLLFGDLMMITWEYNDCDPLPGLWNYMVCMVSNRVEMSPTDAGRDDENWTREDRASSAEGWALQQSTVHLVLPLQKCLYFSSSFYWPAHLVLPSRDGEQMLEPWAHLTLLHLPAFPNLVSDKILI